MLNKIAPMTQSLFPDNIIIQEEFIDCSGNLTPTWHCLIIDFELDNYFRHGGGVLMMRSGGVTVAGSEINSSASRTQQVSKFGEIAQLRLWLLRKIFITFNRSFPDCSKSEFCGSATSCHSDLLGGYILTSWVPTKIICKRKMVILYRLPLIITTMLPVKLSRVFSLF